MLLSFSVFAKSLNCIEVSDMPCTLDISNVYIYQGVNGKTNVNIQYVVKTTGDIALKVLGSPQESECGIKIYALNQGTNTGKLLNIHEPVNDILADIHGGPGFPQITMNRPLTNSVSFPFDLLKNAKYGLMISASVFESVANAKVCETNSEILEIRAGVIYSKPFMIKQK